MKQRFKHGGFEVLFRISSLFKVENQCCFEVVFDVSKTKNQSEVGFVLWLDDLSISSGKCPSEWESYLGENFGTIKIYDVIITFIIMYMNNI